MILLLVVEFLSRAHPCRSREVPGPWYVCMIIFKAWRNQKWEFHFTPCSRRASPTTSPGLVPPPLEGREAAPFTPN